MKTLKISLLAFGVVISMNESAVAAKGINSYPMGFDTGFTPAVYGDLPYETIEGGDGALYSDPMSRVGPFDGSFVELSPNDVSADFQTPSIAPRIGFSGYRGPTSGFAGGYTRYNFPSYLGTGFRKIVTPYDDSGITHGYYANKTPWIPYENPQDINSWRSLYADITSVTYLPRYNVFYPGGAQTFAIGLNDMPISKILPSDVARNNFIYGLPSISKRDPIRASKWRAPSPWGYKYVLPVSEGSGETNFQESLWKSKGLSALSDWYSSNRNQTLPTSLNNVNSWSQAGISLYSPQSSYLIYPYEYKWSGEFLDRNKRGKGHMVYPTNYPRETDSFWMNAWSHDLPQVKPRGSAQGVLYGEYYWQGNDKLWKVNQIHRGRYRDMLRSDWRDDTNSSYPSSRDKTTLVLEPWREVKPKLIRTSPSRNKIEAESPLGAYDKYKTVYDTTEPRLKPIHK